MSLTDNDIRYRAKCKICGMSLGDWALHAPEDKRRCWSHRKFNIQEETKGYKGLVGSTRAK